MGKWKMVGFELTIYWKINENWHGISKTFFWNATILIGKMSNLIKKKISFLENQNCISLPTLAENEI